MRTHQGLETVRVGVIYAGPTTGWRMHGGTEPLVYAATYPWNRAYEPAPFVIERAQFWRPNQAPVKGFPTDPWGMRRDCVMVFFPDFV